MSQSLPFAHAQLTGSPIPESWSQAVQIGHGDDDKEHLGVLYVVVHVTRTDNEDAAFFGRSLISRAEDSYYAKQHDSVYEALTRASADVTELVIREVPRLSNVAVTIAAVHEQFLYAAGLGMETTGLFRGGQLFSLIGPQTLETIKPVSISGKLAPKDYVILGTESFFEHAYPTEELFSGDTPPNEIVDTLSPILLSLPQNAEVAAIILHSAHQWGEAVHGEEPDEMPLPPVAPPEPQAVVAKPEALPPSVVNEGPAIHPLDVVPAVPVKTPKQQLLDTLFRNKVRPMLYAVMKKRGTVSPALSALSYTKFSSVQKRMPRSRSKIIVVVGAIAFILAIVVGTVVVNRVRQAVVANQAVRLFDSAKHTITVAQSLKSQDPQKAETLLIEAKTLVQKAKEKDSMLQGTNELSAIISQELDAIHQVTAIQNPQALFDLTLIKDASFQANKMELVGNAIIVTDAQAPTVLRLDLAKQTGSIATGGSKLPNFLTATANGDQITVVTRDGIGMVDCSTGELKQVIATDPLWGEVIDVSAYLENIYLLDKAKKQIWKYGKAEAGYSAIINVLAENQPIDLGVMQDVAIDGSLWLAGNGKVVRITNGKGQEVVIRGIDQPLGATMRIATTIDGKQLYILDKDNKRVVVVTKDATFVNQYKSQTFADVVDLAADEANNRLLLLTKNKIVSIPITP